MGPLCRCGWLSITTFTAAMSMFIASQANPWAMYLTAAIVGFTYGGSVA